MFRSCFSKFRCIQSTRPLLFFSYRSISDSVDDELQEVIGMHKNKLNDNIEKYFHPVLDTFKLKRESNQGQMCLTRHFGKNETVCVKFGVDHLGEKEPDHDYDSNPDTIPVHDFQISFSVPNQPILRFFANTIESSDQIVISSANIDKGMNYNYKIKFSNLVKDEQDALYAYVHERVGENIGQFISEYCAITDKQFQELWFNDIEAYVRGQSAENKIFMK